jgi:cellulose synthase/poly-beta-1,6-N-acetylglucosamine synthase-like glycosyltransferase
MGSCIELPFAWRGMRVGVVLSTYNRPEDLRLVAEGYSRQTRRPDRILVADDGSDATTAGVVEQAARETGLVFLHVWHPDRGFKKTEILNRALAASEEDLLIFSDGDCIPRQDLVETHLALTREGRFVSGGYLRLPARVSATVDLEVVRTGRVFSLAWLRGSGWRPGRRALRVLPSGRLPCLLDALTPTAATWNGHNSSTLRRHLIEVNGFDLDMGYGGEDRALGLRLENAGVRGYQARHRLPVAHLDHGRPYLDQDMIVRNRDICNRIRRQGETRAATGLSELGPTDEVRITTYGQERGRTV